MVNTVAVRNSHITIPCPDQVKAFQGCGRCGKVDLEFVAARWDIVEAHCSRLEDMAECHRAYIINTVKGSYLTIFARKWLIQ